MRLNGISLDHYNPAQRAAYVRYLTQKEHFLTATLPRILPLWQRHQTPRNCQGSPKSRHAYDDSAFIQRLKDDSWGWRDAIIWRADAAIGLVRALYSDPVILILDEPNSNLDNAGTTALNLAIRHMRATQKSIFIMAQRPATIEEYNVLFVLDGGRKTAFNRREEILASMVQNHHIIAQVTGTDTRGLR